MTVTTGVQSVRQTRFYFDFDPDSADPAVPTGGWKDMRDHRSFLASFIRTVGTGNIDAMIIQGSASSDGSNPVTVKTKTISAQPNALRDAVHLECTIDDLLAAGSGLRYVALSVELQTSTDEGIIEYTFDEPRFQYEGKLADDVS